MSRTSKKWVLRAAATLAVFLLLAAFLQALLTPKFLTDSTRMVDGFYALPEDSVDLLFLGASQMYCAVDPAQLKDEQGVSAYNFGSSYQHLPVSYLYLQEALKTQHPKAVLLEMCNAYDTIADEPTLAWSYAPLPFSANKLRSLYETLDGDLPAALTHCVPLLQYHARWTELSMDDLRYLWADRTDPARGYVPVSGSAPFEPLYTGAAAAPRALDETNRTALYRIQALCQKNGIALILFKTPVCTWSDSDAEGVRQLAREMDLPYWEMHDALAEIGTDFSSDFADEHHMNTAGATKVTAWLGRQLAAAGLTA